jgi:exopolysaccharide biosynthesis polyprenyl glycosylphosphotransferase
MTPASLATAKGRAATAAPKHTGNALPVAPAIAAVSDDTRRKTKDGRWSLALKQTLDYTIAAAGLALTAPLFLVIATLIKINSHGPVLFRQRRVGRNGRVFGFYKFRTMRHDSDDSPHREFSRNFIQGREGHGNGKGNGDGRELLPVDQAETGSVYKLTSDPRVTRVGRFLRRTSLDELPQLLNVLRGDMSLVGPRPPIVYELEHYRDWHKRRLQIKPGITGLWQVSGRSSVPFDEMVQLDLYYIDHRSTLLDLWIMARTLPAVVKGEGAY